MAAPYSPAVHFSPWFSHPVLCSQVSSILNTFHILQFYSRMRTNNEHFDPTSGTVRRILIPFPVLCRKCVLSADPSHADFRSADRGPAAGDDLSHPRQLCQPHHHQCCQVGPAQVQPFSPSSTMPASSPPMLPGRASPSTTFLTLVNYASLIPTNAAR